MLTKRIKFEQTMAWNYHNGWNTASNQQYERVHNINFTLKKQRCKCSLWNRHTFALIKHSLAQSASTHHERWQPVHPPLLNTTNAQLNFTIRHNFRCNSYIYNWRLRNIDVTNEHFFSDRSEKKYYFRFMMGTLLARYIMQIDNDINNCMQNWNQR